MKRLLTVILAVVGALTILGSVVGFVMHRYVGDGSTNGVVLGPDGKPAMGAPIFLDRGTSAIERFVTDSQGRFSLPLDKSEIRRAKWLICVPGGIPMVAYADRDGFQIGPTTYSFTRQTSASPVFIRSYGWLGPVPRECPRPTDSAGWRFPPGTGHRPDAFSITEPDW
jgi:hypothetical protein